MLRLTALLLFVSFNQPPDTAAQDPRLEARLDSATRIEVEAVLAQARADELPVEPLVQKALEGSSKGAPGPRIVSAVQALLADLRRARASLGSGATAGELVAGAAALRAGATPQMVGEIRRSHPDVGLAVPLAVFADLVSGGMSVEAAWRSVSEVAREGGDDEEFLKLRDRLGQSRLSQFSGTIDIGTGPVDWDDARGGDPLVNGALGARYRTGLPLGLRPELLAELGLSTAPTDGAAVRWDLGARLHTPGTSGAWFGAAIGGAGAGRLTNRLSRLEGGIRHSLGPAGINLWMSRTRFGAGVGDGDGLGQDTMPHDSLSAASAGISEYTEIGSRATLGLGDYELGLTLTRRLGDVGIRRTGWEASAIWWAAPAVGLVGATGRSLPQFGFAVPGGRYGTVGLRLAIGSTKPDRALPRESDAAPDAPPRLVVAGRRLTITWRAARQAEVMGDFTDWKPVMLVPVGARRWVLPADLAPGVYHLNVRFDKGKWVVPSGAVMVDDGFGGRVGLVVVR